MRFLLARLLRISMVSILWCSASVYAAPAKPQEELQELRSRIEELQNKLLEQEESRVEVSDSLKESEKAISEVNRRLHNLIAQQQTVQSQMAEIEGRINQLQKKVAKEKDNIEKVIQTRYEASGKDTLKMILSGQNPADVSRQLQYYSYISKARSQMVLQVKTDLDALDELKAISKKKAEEVKGLQSEELEGKKQLENEQNKRKHTLNQLSTQISGQRKEINRLKQNEQQLTNLVEEINRMLEKKRAEAARKRAENAKKRAELAKKKQAEKKNVEKTQPKEKIPEPPVEEYTVEEIADDSLSGKAFVSLKGKLKLPIKGELVNRFGSPRESGGLSWKGIFIKTEPGQTVRSVADGRVVFADWLRGFGNLLIVDHGGGYMSLYGYNESLLKAVGDSIKSGENIAQAGNTGGNVTSGLYFELRYQSKPLNPMSWIAK